MLLRETLLGAISIKRMANGQLVVCKSIQWDQLARLHESVCSHESVDDRHSRPTEVDDPFVEAQIAQMLQRHGHTHIVEYQEIQENWKGMEFTMEFCNQGDLYDEMATRGGAFTEALALPVIRQISSALLFLHERGVAHRDVSLENILIHDGKYKLADFGLATVRRTQCTGRAGKAYYMAPEMVNGCAPYDPLKADVWSLGIVLFILLTGSPLVATASESDKGFAALSVVGVAGILKAWKLLDHIGSDTVALLQGMLEIDPMRRLSMGVVHGWRRRRVLGCVA